MSIFLTSGVILRRPEPRDVEQLYRYRNDWEAISSLRGFSTGYAIKDIEQWIEFHRTRTDEALWVIVEPETDRCLGHVGLYKIDHTSGSAEFAIFIGDPSWWGKGLGSQVSRTVIEFAFQQMNLRRIELSVLETNDAALALYSKIGFVKEGLLRQAVYRNGQFINVVLMGLLKAEYAAR